MSSSTGDPSRKIGWFRSMCAKFDKENYEKEAERRKNAPRITNKKVREQKMEDVVAGK